MVNIADIPIVLAIPYFKVFWCCRCHLVGDDKTTAHEHLHALVQFEEGHTLVAYKKRLQRSKMRLQPKTVFKPIKCPDHAVEVLGYICCEDGQRQTRRSHDGLMGSPHTHYDRSVFSPHLLHTQGAKCCKTKDEIIKNITLHLPTDWLEENGYGTENLHNYKTCLCDRGARKVELKRLTNEKRKNIIKHLKVLALKSRVMKEVV